MKKLLVVIGFFMAIPFLPGFQPSARAAEFKIGLAGMYDMWLPVFRKEHTGESVNPVGVGLKHDEDGSLMLGPTFGVEFGAWRMDLTALFGVIKNDFSYTSYVWDFTVWNLAGGSIFNQYLTLGDSSARRYDVDLKFAKKIHRFFNFNIGGRFNFAKGDGTQIRFLPLTLINYGQDDYHLWQVGPEIGVGFNYEIKGFRLYADVNGLVNFGDNYLERKLIFPNFLPYLLPFKYDTGLMGFGFDTDAGVSYYIAPAHLLIGVGFRWVGVVCASVGDDGSVLDLGYRSGWISGKWDHFYGLTFEVSFKF